MSDAYAPSRDADYTLSIHSASRLPTRTYVGPAWTTEILEVVEHDDWESFVSSDDRPSNIHLFTTHAEKTYWEASFRKGDGLLFGNEGMGPSGVHEWVGSNKLRIPKHKEGLRSLNLAVSVHSYL